MPSSPLELKGGFRATNNRGANTATASGDNGSIELDSNALSISNSTPTYTSSVRGTTTTTTTSEDFFFGAGGPSQCDNTNANISSTGAREEARVTSGGPVGGGAGAGLGLPPLAPSPAVPTSSGLYSTPPTATLPKPVVGLAFPSAPMSSSMFGSSTREAFPTSSAVGSSSLATLSNGGGGVPMLNTSFSASAATMMVVDGQDDDSSFVIREFYRRETLRATMLMLLIAFACLFVVPIIGIMILPVGTAVVYWLKNPYRFQTGGDPAACLNRNSSLNFYIILLCATLFVNAVNLFFLIYELMFVEGTSTESSSSSAEADASRGGGGGALNKRMVMFSPQSRSRGELVTAPSLVGSSGMSSHSSSFLALEMTVNVLCALVGSYSLYVVKRLQKVLDY